MFGGALPLALVGCCAVGVCYCTKTWCFARKDGDEYMRRGSVGVEGSTWGRPARRRAQRYQVRPDQAASVGGRSRRTLSLNTVRVGRPGSRYVASRIGCGSRGRRCCVSRV